jgi:hypothetical protein
MVAASATTDSSSMAATLASLAKTVSALAAKSGVTISSVTSKTEDDSTLSVITTEGAATPKDVVTTKAVASGDVPTEEAAPLVTNDKKKHPPGETTKARLESAGGQFGRNGVGTLNKQSFPTAAVKAATGMQISSVATKPPAVTTVTTPANWLKPKTKRRLSHVRLPLSGEKKRKKSSSVEPREQMPRRVKKEEPSVSK